MRMKVPVKKKKLDDCAKFQNVDQQCVHIKQNKIQLDKEEEENF